MYGKIFTSMFEGSMVGSGATVFAVWSYVIAAMKPHKKTMQVEINPKLLAFILGEPQKDVEKAIDTLCSPDAKSRSKEHGGRRLIKQGEYSYEVVNGVKYREIRNEEQRREQNRAAQERFRAKGRKLAGEQQYEDAQREGATTEEVNAIVTKHLPASAQ